MHFYRVSGLGVTSEMDLPGLIPAPQTLQAPDIVIRLGTVPLELTDPSDVLLTYQIAGDLFLLRIPHVARFLLRAGCEMTVEAEDGTPLDDIAIFVGGTVFGILLHQREQVVLHASAIRVGGKAVLFCGPSGAGKSTMAAALGKRGYAMLSDDVCAITLDGAGRPMTHADGRKLKLWNQAIDQLDLAAQRGPAVRSALEKFYVEPMSHGAEPLPVGAVYMLRETRPPMVDGILQPNFVDAAMAIRRNAYRPRLVRALRQNEHYLRAGAAIAAKAGVYFVNRPLGFSAMPGLIDRLEAHWREIGLLEAAR